jgi:hypothetical protein
MQEDDYWEALTLTEKWAEQLLNFPKEDAYRELIHTFEEAMIGWNRDRGNPCNRKKDLRVYFACSLDKNEELACRPMWWNKTRKIECENLLRS